MERKVRLSIITVNYNGLDDTSEFIHSIQLLNINFPYELIVVDNGSRENEAIVLQQKYPFIKSIRSEQNLGFAGGNNMGISNSSGDYLYFLNNDTVLPANGASEISSMIVFLEKHTHVGALSPKIKYAGGEDIIQFAGSTPLSPITLRNTQIGYQEKEKGWYNISMPIPYLHGAAMLIKREIIDKIGLMPECYFLYYEELDWSCQIKKKYELFYYADATVFHKESRSTGLDSPLKAYYLSRNRLLFAHRNKVGLERLLSKIYLLFAVTPRSMFRYLSKGKFKQSNAVVRGVVSFLTTK